VATRTHDVSADESLGDLTRRVSEAVSRLIRKEAELARAELAAKVRGVAVGAGLGVGAAILGLAAVGAITAAAVLALATTLAAWLAALIVGSLLQRWPGCSA
jgi:Putative Actinobacterial Holin-X, holin superfamily III